MNRADDDLKRLFGAAAQARTDVAAAVPFGLETRVLAGWREGAMVGPVFWDSALLVRGLLVATVLFMLSAWPAVSEWGNPTSDYLQLADSTVQLDGAP